MKLFPSSKFPSVTLASCGEIVTGSTPSKSNGKYWDGEIPFVTPAQLDCDLPITTAAEYVTEEGAKCGRLLPKGAVLVCCIGSLGKTGVAGVPLISNQQINAVIFKEGKVDPRYGYYAARNFSPLLEHFAPSTTIKIVKKSSFAKLQIPLPPLAEQKRIAAILDVADALRVKRRESLAQLDTLLQSTFLDLFGDPVTNPKGWDRKKLGEIINFIGGSQPPKETFIYEPKAGYVRLVQIRDFKSDKYPTYIPEKLAKRPFTSEDVMIARYGPPVFQILTGLSGSYNVALMKAEPIGMVERKFVFYLLDLPVVNAAVVAQSERTAGQTGVNLKFLNDYMAYLPPIELQRRFATIVESVEQQKVRLREHLAELDTLFASLQHRAFNGEL